MEDLLRCPITTQIMLRPVTTEDGCVYEEQALRKWFKISSKSLKTNIKINKKYTIAYTVKDIIDQYLIEHPEKISEQYKNNDFEEEEYDPRQDEEEHEYELEQYQNAHEPIYLPAFLIDDNGPPPFNAKYSTAEMIRYIISKANEIEDNNRDGEIVDNNRDGEIVNNLA